MSSQITLISTPRDFSGIGSRVLSAWLRSLGYDTRLVFLPSPGGGALCSTRAARAVADLCEASDYVGLSVFTSDFNLSVQISQTLRQHTNAAIIWGGDSPDCTAGRVLGARGSGMCG